MNKKEFTQQIAIALAHMVPNNPLACFNTAKNFADEAETRGLFEESCQDRNDTPAVALLRNMDWAVLRLQKDFLRDLLVTYRKPNSGFSRIQGLINLIDAVQAAGVAKGATEVEVFGEQS